MSITSVVNDTVTSVSLINAQKPLPPTITSYSVVGLDDTALDPAGGQTVQINGTGFLAGATITFDGNAVAVVTYVNPNCLTFTSPAKSAGTYTIYVVNPDGGTAIYIPGIVYSLLPTWTTSAGTLGSYYETTSISNTVVASGDAPITYSLYSGSLPPGATLAANGVITGTAPVDSSSTTYSFTIEAIDAQLQSSTRSFSLTINTDVVTWVSPANNTTYTSAVDSAITNVTLSATDAAGYAVSYSANALPTGLSISGSNISGTPTVIADSSTLLTATAATTNRTSTRTINWSITVANDMYFEYNTLLIPGASTTFVDDASTNNFAVSIFGDIKPNSMNPYSSGYYSNYFDGTGDYLVTPTNSAFTFGTEDLTLECWIYQTATSVSTYRVIFADNVYGSAGGYTLYSYNNALNLWKGGSGGVEVIAPAGTLTLNSWTHVAWTRSGSSNRLFINGTQVGATTTDATNYTSTASYIGASQVGSFAFAGYISNARIVKGTAVYTSNFTPSTTPLTAISGTSLLTCQSNRFIDNSTNNFAITVFGNTTVNSFDPFIPNSSYSTYGSAYIPGAGSTYINAGGNTALALGSGNFTIECWLYLSSLGTYTTIFDWRTNGSAGSGIPVLIDYANNGTLTFAIGNGSAFATPVVSSSVMPINRWFHLALVRNGSTITMYFNGVSVGSGTDSSTLGVETFNIASPQVANYNAPMYVTDVRLVKGTAVYTTTFTPPTAPLTAIANTSLLTLQNHQSVNNNVFLDNSTNNFLVTRAGNTTQGTFSPYGGNWSNYLTSSNYLSFASSSTLAPNTNSFTMEFWYNSTSTGNGRPLGNGGSSAAYGANKWVFASNNSAGKLEFFVYNYGSGSPMFSSTSSTVASDGQWHHIAIVRSVNTWAMFIDGTRQGSTITSSVSFSGTSSPLSIGWSSITGDVTGFSGYISNFRFVNGSAVYDPTQTTITVPTSPLTSIANTSLLTCQSNRFIDNSSNTATITLSGTPTVQRFSPFNPSSVTPTSYSNYFDNTGDYLTAPANTALAMGSGAFTMEAWVYNVGGFSTDPIFESRSSAPSASGYAFLINSSGYLNVYTNSAFVGQSSTALVSGSWYHVALVRTGTGSNQTTYYINGVASGTITLSGNFTDASTVVTTIGGSTSAGENFGGYISNARIVKGTAVYTSNFTPSTTPLTAISGTSLLTCQSTTFIDNSTNNFTISAFGNTKPTIQNPYGYTSTTTNGYTVSTIGGSGYFDGTGDNLSLTTVTAVETSDTTVEFWFYPTSASVTYRGIYDSRSATDTNTGYGIFQYGLTIEVYGNGLKVASAASAFAINVWNHVALVRTSGICQLYINGIASGSTGSYSSSLTSTIRRIGDGVNTLYPFVGYISDVREATKALYTSNFVPSLTPLTAVQNTSLLTNMTSAGIYDASMMNDMETVGDAKLSTAVTKFGGSSMSFDGTGDVLSTAASQNFVFNGDFTVEGWVYIDSTMTSTRPDNLKTFIFMGWNTGNTPQLYVYGNTTTPGIGLGYYDSTSAWQVAVTVPKDQWVHIAYVRTGTTLYGFVAGTRYTINASISATIGTNNTMVIAGNPNQSAAYYSYLKGYIDDLRITKGYARYTANFTPPTAPFQIY